MNEELFQFIWQCRLYETRQPLLTTEGEEIIVHRPGMLNRDAGPDFLNALLSIGPARWAGHVELHVRSSDWLRHGHQHDARYANVILHVVFEDDAGARLQGFPTLVLGPRIDMSLLHRYRELLLNQHPVACAPRLNTVPELIVRQQLDRMLAERVSEKGRHLSDLLMQTNHNWHEAFYVLLARSFGAHVNREAFEDLALRTPLWLILKYREQTLRTEALLFGQSGLLQTAPPGEYADALRREYAYLQKVHELQPMPAHRWKFLRLRPANFPTLRLAQFAALMRQEPQLLQRSIELRTMKDVRKCLSLPPSPYWTLHYSFGESARGVPAKPGNSFIHGLLINALIPALFLYGKQHGRPDCSEKALDWLRELPAENNRLLRAWSGIGLHPEQAGDSQALLHLMQEYCDKKACLQCSIGHAVLKRG
jgi:hypothetical protein